MPLNRQESNSRGGDPYTPRPRCDLWPLSRTDAVFLALLVIAPFLLFAIPTLAGHPPLAGDNLIQNFPLRVLVGKQLDAGHLPLWNPLAFSGSPLLGAMNAGALFPGTLLFAVLPNMFAWVVNLAGCYVAAGTGLYVLTRWLGIRPLSAMFGAVSYAFTGMMIGQMVHLGVIQGQALLPWVLLSLLVIAERLRGARSKSTREAVVSTLWPLLALVILTALIVLTGEPRAITDFGVVVVIAGAFLIGARALKGSLRSRILLLVCLGGALLWGLALSAIEYFPAQNVISLSQRSQLTPAFIGSGSLRTSWTALLLIPDLIGGTGLFHQPVWFIEYNLPEVTGYAGLLAVAAAFAALGQLLGRRRRHAPVWLGMFVTMIVVGLVLSWGMYTNAFHVILHIPVLNRTRLQSRNLAIVDLALAVLLAWFLDRILAQDFVHASLQAWRRWLTVLPVLGTAVLALVALLWPFGLEEAVGANAAAAVEGHYLWTWISVSLGLALILLGLLLGAQRLRAKPLRRGLIVFMAADVLFFLLACTTGLVSGNATAEPSRATALTVLNANGRFALVDPTLSNLTEFVDLGKTNTNVFTGLPSVQGYGSLVPDVYGVATGTHNQDGLDACNLAAGTYAQLQLSSLVLGTTQLAPLVSSPQLTPSTTVVARTWPPCASGQPSFATARSRPFYFGATQTVTSLELRASSASGALSQLQAHSVQVSLLGSNGGVFVAPSTQSTTASGVTVTFVSPQRAAGVVLEGAVGSIATTSRFTTTSGEVYSFNGQYQAAADESSWRLTSTTATYQAFQATAPIVAMDSLAPGAGAGSRVRSTKELINGTESDVIHLTSAATIVRSEAYMPGWRASFESTSGGATRTVAVVRHGLVQAFPLPAGDWNVRVTYHPPGLVKGELLTAASGLAFVVVVAWGLFLSRRRRAHKASAE